MPDDSNVPHITMASNKQEMLDAYSAMKQLVERQQKDVINAERERERFRKEAAEASAERALSEDPVQRIQGLRSQIAEQLRELADQYEAETQAYARLKEAVIEKQSELARIFEVETAATDLAALIEAHRQIKERFEAEMAAGRGAWERDEEASRQRVSEERTALERKLAWDKEEFEHDLARQRDQRRVALEDELAKLERETVLKRADAEREFASARKELDERAETIAARETQMSELEAQLRALRDERDGTVERAVKDATARLRETMEHQQALATKQFEGERNVLAGRLEALQQLVDRQTAQIEHLNRSQEQAYEKVQEIATKAVDGARRQLASVATLPQQSTSGGTREGSAS